MFYERFIETVNKEKQKKETYISEGHAHDYPEYRFVVGQIRGLQDAIEMVEYIYKQGGQE